MAHCSLCRYTVMERSAAPTDTKQYIDACAAFIDDFSYLENRNPFLQKKNHLFKFLFSQIEIKSKEPDFVHRKGFPKKLSIGKTRMEHSSLLATHVEVLVSCTFGVLLPSLPNACLLLQPLGRQWD